MSRTGIVIIAVLLAMPGTVFAQGILDSVLGQGGLGIWGPQTGQFDSPQYYGGSMSAAPAYPQGPEQQQYGGGYPQGYGYPQNQGYGNNQSGFYPDWYYNQPQAGTQAAPPVQYSAPPTAQYQGPPPAQYQAPPPAQYQAPPPAQYQAPPPVQYAAPQVARPQQQVMPPQQMGYPQGASAPPPPSQGQYPPVSGFDSSFQFDETLPAGAVRVTTSTPDGTTVQYYPPNAETQMMAPPAQAPGTQPQTMQRPAPRRLRAGQAQAAKAQTATPKQASSIAMPKPVQIPQGQDPRIGWSGAVSTGTAGPTAR